jgi:hypothetical protein
MELGATTEALKQERERILAIIPLIREELKNMRQTKFNQEIQINNPEIYEAIKENIKKNYERFQKRKSKSKRKKTGRHQSKINIKKT